MENKAAYNIPIINIMEILYNHYGEGVTHVDFEIAHDRLILIRPSSNKKDDDILNELK